MVADSGARVKAAQAGSGLAGPTRGVGVVNMADPVDMASLTCQPTRPICLLRRHHRGHCDDWLPSSCFAPLGYAISRLLARRRAAMSMQLSTPAPPRSGLSECRHSQWHGSQSRHARIQSSAAECRERQRSQGHDVARRHEWSEDKCAHHSHRKMRWLV